MPHLSRSKKEFYSENTQFISFYNALTNTHSWEKYADTLCALTDLQEREGAWPNFKKTLKHPDIHKCCHKILWL